MSVQPDMTDDQPRRRGYDHMPELEALEQRLLYAMGEKLSDTRHAMRNEFGASMTELSVSVRALAKEVEANTRTSSLEHQEVQMSIRTLTEDVAELRKLVPRVDALESSERTDHAVSAALERNRVQMRNWSLAIVTAIVGAVGVLAAFMPH